MMSETYTPVDNDTDALALLADVNYTHIHARHGFDGHPGARDLVRIQDEGGAKSLGFAYAATFAAAAALAWWAAFGEAEGE